MINVLKKSIDQIMEERSSVRKYQKGKTIPKETLNEILRLAGTAPSSWNLQHWRFLVVEDQANKEKLLPVTYNQQQTVDASAVIVLLGDKEADKVAGRVYENAPENVKNALIGNIENAYANVPNFGHDEAIRNASFAGMQLMLAAKAYGLDTCPMGGFNPKALVEELKIPDRYIPVMMLTIGYAESPAHPTDRFPVDELIIKETF